VTPVANSMCSVAAAMAPIVEKANPEADSSST
jgi:hypothetical protein